MSADLREWVYNGLDVCVTHEVVARLNEMLNADPGARKTYEFELAMMAPVFEMNLRGLLVDEDARLQAIQELNETHKRLRLLWDRLVREGVGCPFEINYRSHQQLKQFFYGVLGIKAIKARSSNGKYLPTVNRDAMEKLQMYFSAQLPARIVLALRDIDKKLQLLESEIDEDGRARTSYNIAGTNTGRMSSSASDWGTGGNKQNVERALRRVFVSDPAMKFCNIDLEQADARHVGALCWELFYDKFGPDYAGAYLDACESGDLHTTVCRMAWHDLDWAAYAGKERELADELAYRTYSYRDMAKKLGHGTNYFGTPRTMAAHSKVDVGTITQFQVRYFGAFPAIGNGKHKLEELDPDTYHGWVGRQLQEFGRITTPHYGRSRTFYGRPDNLDTLRQAIAYSPQSMTADAIDTGMLELWRTRKVHMLAQVHDSILFQYPVELEEEIIPQALALLEIHYTLKGGRDFYVPAEAKIGFNWADFDEKENPYGLIKWKGPGLDQRTRPDYRTFNPTRSLKDLINSGTELSKLL